MSKEKVPAPVGEGREQEEMLICFGQSELHITQKETILLVNRKSHRHSGSAVY